MRPLPRPHSTHGNVRSTRFPRLALARRLGGRGGSDGTPPCPPPPTIPPPWLRAGAADSRASRDSHNLPAQERRDPRARWRFRFRFTRRRLLPLLDPRGALLAGLNSARVGEDRDTRFRGCRLSLAGRLLPELRGGACGHWIRARPGPASRRRESVLKVGQHPLHCSHRWRDDVVHR